MLSLEVFRTSLGVYAQDFSDSELIKARVDMYQLSHLAIDYYLKNIYKNQPITK